MVIEFKLELTRASYVIEINFMLDDEEIFVCIRNLQFQINRVANKGTYTCENYKRIPDPIAAVSAVPGDLIILHATEIQYYLRDD